MSAGGQNPSRRETRFRGTVRRDATDRPPLAADPRGEVATDRQQIVGVGDVHVEALAGGAVRVGGPLAVAVAVVDRVETPRAEDRGAVGTVAFLAAVGTGLGGERVGSTRLNAGSCADGSGRYEGSTGGPRRRRS